MARPHFLSGYHLAGVFGRGQGVAWAGLCGWPCGKLGQVASPSGSGDTALSSPASDANLTSDHAILASIPGRTARPAAGVGRRWPARETAQGGARVEGVVAVQQGEDAFV